MTEANRTYATTPAPQVHKELGNKTKLAIAAILGLAIGFYVGKSLSNEPMSQLQLGVAAGPATDSATQSQGAGDDPGYFPNQFVNQAKEIEPLPPTF